MAERNPSRPTLARLARLYGLQTSYADGRGVRRHASPQSVRVLLEALGAPLATTRPRDIAAVSDARRRAAWARPVEPVLVAWRGRRVEFLVRGIETGGPVPARCRLRLADGRTRTWTVRADEPAVAAATVDGVAYRARRARLPARLPDGYHDLDVEIGRRSCRSLVVAAPPRAYDDGGRTWGVFLPLHALQSAGSWGVGDFTDLEALAAWVASEGGTSVALLPLLAAFLGERPFEPSPYLPVSRLFWNELYVDPRRLPEFAHSEPARRLVASAEFRGRVEGLRAARLVDYRGAMALRRRVLELLARALDDRADRRRAAFEDWIERCPPARDYAAFRATGELLARSRAAVPPPTPPAPPRREPLPAPPGERHAVRYHLYAQWAAAEQIGQLARNAAARGGGLHLDIPVGVHPDGFDVWRHPTLFARGAALGAPPDPMFAEGQDWSAPPPHPETVREDAYAYFRASLAHQMGPATAVRLDHVMGLHRLFWIPSGGEPADGAYVRYRSEELYAIVCLESHRHRTRVVGENLGTVPRSVDAALSRYGLARTHVAQFAVNPGAAEPLGRVPRRAFACVNTHDTPTFAGFLDGRDIDARVAGGRLDADGAERERRRRRAAAAALRAAAGEGAGAGGKEHARAAADLRTLWACLDRLARSAASVVTVNLEDLWREPRPQNVPGTGAEKPNWRRRARYGLEVLRDLPGVTAALRDLARRRPRG